MSSVVLAAGPGAAEICRTAAASRCAPTIEDSSSTGTVSEATSAVETPRLPIPFSARVSRSTDMLTKLSANDWYCSPDWCASATSRCR